MEYLESFIVALLQGITEFLPISSSGHVVLAQSLMGLNLEQGQTFNIITHLGTLVSIGIYFYHDLKLMVGAAVEMLLHPLRIKEMWNRDEATRINIYILLSMLPAGIAGFTIREQLDSIFLNPTGISCMFLFTGFLLYATKYFESGRRALTATNTFLVGIAQAVALIPGISRSGTTISVAVFLGINRDDIARFTFLMMIPVVAGAALVEFVDIGTGDIEASYLPHLLLGFVVSVISGYFSLKYLIRLFKSSGIHYFAWYCWIIGIAGLIYFL